MDISDLREASKRWIAKCRLQARRISSVMPVTATARDPTLLPHLFLVIGLLAGLRVADSEMWRPPLLSMLVLAALMVGALNRHGAFALERLLNSFRSTLDLKGCLWFWPSFSHPPKCLS